MDRPRRRVEDIIREQDEYIERSRRERMEQLLVRPSVVRDAAGTILHTRPAGT